MGARVARLAEDDERFTITPTEGRLDDEAVEAANPSAVDAIIDFTNDSGARGAARFAEATGAAILVGTTALTASTIAMLEQTARVVPLMIAPNTSLGMALLRRLTRDAARALGGGYDVDVVERHHVFKKDAPSGSALLLAEAVAEGRGEPLPPERVHAIRAGDIVGEHEVELTGPGERFLLAHSVTDRDVFARGALRAAAWLTTQEPGRVYQFDDSVS